MKNSQISLHACNFELKKVSSKQTETLDIVGTVYHLVIYMNSNYIHIVLLWLSLFIIFVSSTMFRPEASNSTCITTYQSAHTALKDSPEDGPVSSETLKS
jgi:hypothetical protein